MDKGYFTIAQNNSTTDYMQLAYGLALSIKNTQEINNISLGITPGIKVPDKYRLVFDHIIEIPFLDAARRFEWKLQNEWKVFHMTPYEETIKLAADMYFPADISHWWKKIAKMGEIFLPTNVRTHREDIIEDNIYRKAFTENNLPNVYSDFTYFKKSMFTYEFFTLLEDIFKNWEDYFTQFIPNKTPTYFSTDIAYALAIKIFGIKLYPLETPTFSHLKVELMDIGLNTTWQGPLRTDFNNGSITIGDYKQRFPIHYHEKDFLKCDMIEILERKLGI